MARRARPDPAHRNDVGASSAGSTQHHLTEAADAIRRAHDDTREAAIELARCARDAGLLLAQAKAAADSPAAWKGFVTDQAGISMKMARRYETIAASGLRPSEIGMSGLTGLLAYLGAPDSVEGE